MMTMLAYYTLAAFGLWYIVGASVISYPARAALKRAAAKNAAADYLLDLLQCPACFGVWVGAVIAFTRYSPMPEADFASLALYTGATNLILGHLTNLMPE
jgi:hypothetical protein